MQRLFTAIVTALVFVSLVAFMGNHPLHAQSALLQGGPMTPGHVPMYASGGYQGVLMDSGTAAGGGPGIGLSELGVTARGAGLPPFANAGTGPFNTNICDYDGLITSSAGFHFLCLGPNSLGGGLLAYGNSGSAAGLPFDFKVNGNDAISISSSGVVSFPNGAIISPSVATNSLVAPTGSSVTSSLGNLTARIADITDYGAKCDGSTNDSAAYNAAKAALPLTGGTIRFPANAAGCVIGPVTVDKSILHTSDGGSYNAQAKILAGTPTSIVFDVTAQFVSFTNLAFAPAPNVPKQTAGAYIQVEGTGNRFFADHLTMQDFYEGILVPSNASPTAPATVVINNFSGLLYCSTCAMSNAGIHLQNGVDVRINNVFMEGTSRITPASVAGIWIENVQDANIVGGDILAMGSDLYVNPGNGQNADSVWITSVELDSASYGMNLCPTGTGSISRGRAVGSWASNQVNNGIHFCSGVNGFDVSDTIVVVNGADGIRLDGGSNINVHGGVCADNTGYCMSVASGVSFWSVQNMSIGAVTGLPANTSGGVFVPAGASDYYKILDNLFVSQGGGSNNEIVDSGTGIHKVIVNNPGTAINYDIYRDNASGMLFFQSDQPTFGGFQWNRQNSNNTPSEIMQLTNPGDLSFSGALSEPGYAYASPSTGFSLAPTVDQTGIIIDPSGTLASGTITMPANPKDGQIETFSTSQTITSLTVLPYSGQSTTCSPTTLAAGESFSCIYRAANLTWYTWGKVPSNISNGVTGTGSVVLATSPTLVTPNLGIGTAVALILDDGSHNNYTLGRDGTTGYLFFNGKQSLYSGYEFQVNNGTTVLTINNAGLATFADGIASSSLATFAGGIAASDGSPGSPTSCGSGSPSVSGTNTRGTITLGTTPSACTLPWSTTLASAPVCVVSGGAATTIPSVTSTSTSNMVIGGTLVTGGKVNYICMQ